jgi:hypothetical protein
MVMLPEVTPVMVIEQEPEERVQLPGLAILTVPVPDWVKVNVPVGDEPVTLTVQVEVYPLAMPAGVQVTVVVVVTGGVTVRTKVPELARLSSSPL